MSNEKLLKLLRKDLDGDPDVELVSASNLMQEAADVIDRLQEALTRIAKDGYGLQGIIEDCHDDVNAYNYYAMNYWRQETSRRRQIAKEALKD